MQMSATETLYACLGQEDRADLKEALRGSEADAALHAAIEMAIQAKPCGHDFQIDRGDRPTLACHMSTLGGLRKCPIQPSI